MEDLVLQAEAATADFDALPTAVVGVAQTIIVDGDGVVTTHDNREALRHLSAIPHIILNRVHAARRLGVARIEAYDVLELFAFVRPARYALPTIRGMLNICSLDLPYGTAEEDALAVKAIASRLLAEAGSETYRYRAGASRLVAALARAGWLWAPLLIGPLGAYRDDSGEDGIAVWSALEDWEDDTPPPPPGDEPIAPQDSLARLEELKGDQAEDRPGQKRYAETATHIFRPREFADGPNMQLLEAGTGTGKTLGYIAPASVWAEKNDAPVWVATYTKNLQRQIDQELNRLYPDPRIKAKRAVVRKGRENYACLLNIEETTRAVMMRLSAGGAAKADMVLMALVLRWARFSRDGDMIGGDFPSWLGAHFGAARIAGLTDRRGECLYSACAHYRKCFIEKAVRKARHADIVVANHALVMVQAATRGDDPELPKRVVFDEGHHVFDAADSAFSVRLGGLEGADLRRWLRGKEQAGTTRARGLASRLEELITDDAEAKSALDAVLEAARILPGDGWLGRISGAAPQSAFERFLMLVRSQVMMRSDTRGPYSLEITTGDPIDGLVDAGQQLAAKLDMLYRPLGALGALLLKRLADDSDTLDSFARGRLESSARSLALRAEMVRLWVSMAADLQKDTPDDFIDWFEVDRIDGRERDISYARHFTDPTKPFAEIVMTNMAGTLITSATLRDTHSGPADPDHRADWRAADVRTGMQHMAVPPKRLSVESPFDYGANTRIYIVGDVNKHDPDQVAAAYKALFLASGGGALGLFTAIARLRNTYAALAPDLEYADMHLYAQHVDPIDTATLVDMFRDEKDSCLLGTDAVRDGVDVPGDSLRLIVFDRVPWPRPNHLHRARRAAFGGKSYDEMLTRLKLLQAYGRLIRRTSDRGVFVMLDGQTPTRLLNAFPPDVEIVRTGLADAVKGVQEFLHSNT